MMLAAVNLPMALRCVVSQTHRETRAATVFHEIRKRKLFRKRNSS